MRTIQKDGKTVCADCESRVLKCDTCGALACNHCEDGRFYKSAGEVVAVACIAHAEDSVELPFEVREALPFVPMAEA